VLGIERFRLGHDRGASQDHSRIIRLAQHQSPYAALAPDAYESWYGVLSELALNGSSNYPIKAFSIMRPAVTDESFERAFHA
jgi:hypothetical protein